MIPPPPDTRTRDRLLETAARLFHEQGYAATGVATILREAGVHSGSLYHYFPSKDELLAAVLERYKELLHPLVMAPVEAAEPDPIERVFRLLEQYRAWLAPMDWAMGCPIGNLALEVADHAPQARPLIAENFANWAAVVRGWLEEAGHRLPAETDRDGLARFVLTVMEGGVMQSRAEGSSRPYEASVRQLRKHFELLMDAAPAGRAAGKTPARRR